MPPPLSPDNAFDGRVRRRPEGSRSSGVISCQSTMEVPVTAPTEASRDDGRAPASRLGTGPPALLRTSLLVGLDEEVLRFAQLQATFAALTADPANTTGRDRAVAALRMYRARAVIEELEAAIVRCEVGSYGTCRSCHRPISPEGLETTPHGYRCGFCATTATLPAWLAGPRLHQERREPAAASAFLPAGLAPHPQPTAHRARRRRVAAEPLDEQDPGVRPAPKALLRAKTPGDRRRTSTPLTVAPDPLVLVRSRDRHPSSERHEPSLPGPVGPVERSSGPAADAPAAVRRLLTLAKCLLDADADESRNASAALVSAPLQRVALLRDELHVTANRVARFGVDEHPIVDPVRIAAPTVASSVLAPGRLLSQLGMAADRLIALLERLTPRDWSCTCRMGDRIVTLGDLVDGVLGEATHDLLHRLHDVTESPAQERMG